MEINSLKTGKFASRRSKAMHKSIWGGCINGSLPHLVIHCINDERYIKGQYVRSHKRGGGQAMNEPRGQKGRRISELWRRISGL